MKQSNSNNVRSFQSYQKMIKQKSTTKLYKSKINDQNNQSKIVLTPKQNLSLQSPTHTHQHSQSSSQHNNNKQSSGYINNKNNNKMNATTHSNTNINSKNNNLLTIKQPQQNKKQLSPNRHKNHNHSPIKTVPLSQIQIILESIQQIKQKANLQIQQHKQKNNQLQLQNLTLRKQLQKMKQLQASLQNSNKQQQHKYRQRQQLTQNRINETLIKQRIWLQQKQQYIQQFINVKQTNRLLQQQVSQLNGQLQRANSTIQQWISKHTQLVNTITLNKPQRLSQLLYQLQQHHQNKSILDILLQQQKQLLISQKQTHLLSQQLTTLKHFLQEQKQQRTKTQLLLNNIMQQNKQLIQSMANKQSLFIKEKQQLNQLISQAKLDGQQYKVQLQTKMNRVNQQLHDKIEQMQYMISQLQQKLLSQQHNNQQLQQTIQSLHQHISQYQHTIQQLKSTITQLQSTITTKQHQIKLLQQQLHQQQLQYQMHYKYFDIVDQQCSELHDLTHIVTKLQSIEKIKLQNQTNIQKIQFLSKMLDC